MIAEKKRSGQNSALKALPYGQAPMNFPTISFKSVRGFKFEL